MKNAGGAIVGILVLIGIGIAIFNGVGGGSQTIDSGFKAIPGDKAWYSSFEMYGQYQVEIKVTEKKGQSIWVLLLDKQNFDRFQGLIKSAGTIDEAEWEKRRGEITFRLDKEAADGKVQWKSRMGKGDYFLWVESDGDHDIGVDYSIVAH